MKIASPQEMAALRGNSLRLCLLQGERAMLELGWTMSNTNWRGTLEALVAQAESALPRPAPAEDGEPHRKGMETSAS